MACKNCYISIKILKDLPPYKEGKILKVQATDGMPSLKYWRDRLRDAKIDGCVEIVKPTVVKSTPTKEGDTK